MRTIELVKVKAADTQRMHVVIVNAMYAAFLLPLSMIVHVGKRTHEQMNMSSPICTHLRINTSKLFFSVIEEFGAPTCRCLRVLGGTAPMAANFALNHRVQEDRDKHKHSTSD